MGEESHQMSGSCGPGRVARIGSTPDRPGAIGHTRTMAKQLTTDTPFAAEVPRLLAERGMSVSALARLVGVGQPSPAPALVSA